MSQATYVQDGKTIDYTPGSNVAAGDVVVQGDLVGVATRPIAANALGALAVSGVLDFDKDTGSAAAISAGANVYWDAVSEVATTTAGSNKLIGKAIADADADDETVRVRMSQ
jgi:predicted RecA/RadA family phage recombinase